MIMKKIAAHRIILPSGEVLRMEVVSLNDRGEVIEHHPLSAEEAGVEWYVGELKIEDWRLKIGD